jgi:hypothetical protein
MKVELNEKFKIASVWLTNEEKNNLEIREELDKKNWGVQRYKLQICHI